MAIKVEPKFEFPTFYKDVINVLQNNNSINSIDLFSGRNSGKSYNVYQFVIIDTFAEKDNNVLILRASQAQIMKSVYTLMLNIIDSMGLTMFFRPKRKSMQIENIVSGSIIYFDGVDDDPEKIKGFTPRNNKIAMVIFEEFTELTSEYPIAVAEQTLVRFRGSESNGRHIKFIKMGNPSRWNSHWSWNTIEMDKKNPKCKVFSPIWKDIVGFLELPTIEYIINLQLTNERYYKWAYEGQRMSYEGLVYPMFNESCLADESEYKDKMPISVICGLDPASKRDKTSFIIGILFNTGELLFDDIWVYNPKDVDCGQLSPSEQGERIISFFNEWVYRPENARYRYLPKILICDPASGGLDVELRNNYGNVLEVLVADKKDRITDLSRNQNALSTGRVKFKKNVDNLKILFDELSMMVWRDKLISKELKTIKSTQLTIGEDDCHDSMTYVITFALTNARFMQYNPNMLSKL